MNNSRTKLLRVLLLVFLVLVCEPVVAVQGNYAAWRKSIEEQCATNTTPKEQRIFVKVVATREAMIVPFHKGITLREIIGQTSFKGRTAWVGVLRPDHPLLDDLTRVGRREEPKDKVKALDVIVIFDQRANLNT